MATAPTPTRHLAFKALLFALMGMGLLSRLAPLFDPNSRMLTQFPSEDGYLMLTIARNLALGHGMSTAAGTIPTNGTQPLFNLIEALGFLVSGGDRHGGVLFALLAQVAAGIAGTFLLYRLTQLVLRDRLELSSIAAPLAAALWFGSAIFIPHAMNCLETGLYGTMTVASVYAWYRLWLDRKPDAARWGRAARLGVVLGLTFLTRIDAVFLIAAITATHWLAGVRIDGAATGKSRLIESVVAGAVSVVVSSPWLANNLIRFGSVMPISGTAQSHSASFGTNLPVLPTKLVEYFGVVAPLPASLEALLAVKLACAAISVAYIFFVARSARRHFNANEQVFVIVYGSLVLCLAGYYGLFFGAAHFVPRYLFPSSGLTCIVMATAAAWAFRRLQARPQLRTRLAYGLGGAALLWVGTMHTMLYARGMEHGHFQVVRWVEDNVEETVWVGAVQTGTLGFFHDRTINLDGKVNPNALAANLQGALDLYVAEERFGQEQQPIEFIVDWAAVGPAWRHGAFLTHFELTLVDHRRNISVLSRRPQPLTAYAAAQGAP